MVNPARPSVSSISMAAATICSRPSAGSPRPPRGARVQTDRYGRRRGLVTGLVVFGGASLAASMADTPTQLIAARAVMGVGGAFLMPGTLSIITTVFDDAERKKAIAIWSSVLMLGALAG